MNHRAVLLSLVLIALVTPAFAGDTIPLSPSETAVTVRQVEGGGEILVVTVSEVRLDAIEIEGRSWAVVRVPRGHNSMDYGHPSLPYLPAEYLLGRQDAIELELIESTVRQVDLGAHGFAGVAPSKGHFDRTVDPDSVPWLFDEKIYQSSDVHPTIDAQLDRPFISGPIRGQAMRLPVVRWQAANNLLTVIEEAQFRVKRLAAGPNPRLRPDPPMTGLFDMAAGRMVNSGGPLLRDNPFVEAGRLLIIADDDFLDEIQPLADWHHKVGYPTLVTPTSVSGSTAAQIHSYIQSVYDQPGGLAWIILVGDNPQIPTLTGVNSQHSPCDPCYTKLEGSDNRPDAAISRISAQNGAQVTAQVNKILSYERYPDEGSAGAWYQKGFGIGSDDTGGTGLADWERIELLRQDLLDPAYTFTEFDQIYHSSATASQVTTAVNQGRSLGAYIGHGWDGGWVTTGFDTGDANALTNGEMLPVIWSVACNNGEFPVNECFAEAWLRNDAGGAVSFEGGTTTESWVPPCDAQRGIIDSLRLETAFTTGGQHMAGKHYCMDVNGDSDSSQGNKWVEQSTLFGSPTTWMRTLPAVWPDEPDDFSSAGGMASLTVKVGGQPLAKANAAVVSFYTTDGNTVTQLGSGLIDANGHVQAVVSGEPTHCHIHGQNLVPAEFELAARDDGRISLDAAAYGCTGTVGVRVADANVPGSGAGTVDTVDVTLSIPGTSIDLTLTETGADRNLYAGSAVLGTDLVVAHGDVLTATYVDADDGDGGSNITKTAQASVDCAGPVVSGLAAVEVGATSAIVEWTTDEPGDSWAVANPGGIEVSEGGLRTEHRLVFDGLQECTFYTVEAASTDALGNTGFGGPTSPFMTLEQTVAMDDDVESGAGEWVVDTAIGGGVNWTIVADGHAHSPTHAWFTSDYSNVKDDRLVAGPFDLGGGTTTLSFWHEYDTESGYDGGVLEVSTNGSTWQDVTVVGAFVEGGYNATLSAYGSNPLAGRNAWAGSSGGFVHTVADLSALAGSQVWLRFRLGCDGSVSDVGWWVDDIRLETTTTCSGMLFVDGFESGDCSMWNIEVP